MFWTMYSAKPLFPKALFALPTVHFLESDKFLLWGAIIHLAEPGSWIWSHSDVICLLKFRGLHVLNRVYYKTQALFALPTVHFLESDKFHLWGAVIHLAEPGSWIWSHSDVICLLKFRGLHVLNRAYYKTPLSQLTVCIAHSPFLGIW